VPDSPENRKTFVGQDAGAERGASGYPIARVVTLMALRSHLLLAPRFGPYDVSERKHARDCLRAIKFQLALFAAVSPGKIPKVLDRFHPSCALPPRRSERLYPRAVKIKMSSYPRKRPSVK